MIRWGVPSLLAAIAIGYLLVAASGRVDPAAPNPDGTIEGLTDVY